MDDERLSEGSVAVSQAQIKALESRVENLNSIVRSLQQTQSVASTTQPSSSNRTPLTEGQSRNSDQVSQPIAAEYLSKHGSGKMRYITSAHWAAMCREVTELDEILSSQGMSAAGSPESPVQDADDLEQVHVGDNQMISSSLNRMERPTLDSIPQRSAELLPSARRTYGSVASLWRHMPPKAQCDHFLNCYFRGCHPLVPLVHVPTFWQRYSAFWEASEAEFQQPGATLSFTTLMLALMYQGAYSDASRKQVQTDPNRNQLHDRASYLRNLTVKALRWSNFSRTPTLDTLRAYLIAQSTTAREEEPLSNVAFVGMALRIANMLGLHRDPCHFPSISLVEAEERRRTWWHVVHIDTTVSVAAGLPFVIDDDTWDVQTISELNDRYIGTQTGAEYDASAKRGDSRPENAALLLQASERPMVTIAGILAGCKLRFTSVSLLHFIRCQS